jgi:hypothetical protein
LRFFHEDTDAKESEMEHNKVMMDRWRGMV